MTPQEEDAAARQYFDEQYEVTDHRGLHRRDHDPGRQRQQDVHDGWSIRQRRQLNAQGNLKLKPHFAHEVRLSFCADSQQVSLRLFFLTGGAGMKDR
jgi:hypothetical protein